MTIKEINQAVDDGKAVQWKHAAYQVIKDKHGQYLIHCLLNDNYINLTNRGGDTLNGIPSDFRLYNH